MADSFVNFSLQNPTPSELGLSLARCFAEFKRWKCEAISLEQFVHDADSIGVRSVIADRFGNDLDLALELGLFIIQPGTTPDMKPIVEESVRQQITSALRGAKLAATVLIHNAADLFFWRIVRIGLAGNREAATKLVSERKISVATLRAEGDQGAIDIKIDEWWNELERKSLPAKWDCAVHLFGFPRNLTKDSWHFDRAMLVDFDEMRHNAVHDEGQNLLAFHLDDFTSQLSRGLLCWVVTVAEQLNIKLPADYFAGVKR